MIEPRIHFEKYAPEALRAMDSLERHLFASSLGEALLHLVRMRASQIMVARTAWTCMRTTRDARRNRATPVCTERPAREQATLAWTEALTPMAQTRVPDEG
jgi:alkylhydroperoxidase family enzyme